VVTVLVENRIPYREAEGLFRSAYLDEAMRFLKGNQCQVAQLSGLHRNTVSRRLRQSGLLAKWRTHERGKHSRRGKAAKRR
jgi:DNA-binding NtrC family response regulator